MDKSKLIAIAALVIGLGCIIFFKEAPPPPEGDDDHDHETTATQKSPDFDVVGGVKELQKVDVRVGTGPVAKAGDNVTVNYRGTLLNGKMFDESYGKAPFDFQLGAGRVIKGWDLGVAGMKVGGKRQLTIPGDMAYGAGGQGEIPPNATLKFDVELLKVNGKS